MTSEVEQTVARFGGKVVVVTGAASGIGKACALRFARERALVACLDIDEEGVRQTASEVAALGGRATSVRCNVSNAQEVVSALASARTELGRLSAVANVAGSGRTKKFSETSLDDWNRALEVNLTGTFLVCHAALPDLLESRGAIVNVSSAAGVRAAPYATAYSAAKAGVIGFSKSLAAELAKDGVRVNCVCPGPIETPLTEAFVPPGREKTPANRVSPMKRYGSPEEVAGVVAFLASSEASFMTGAAVAVDGGMIA